MPRPSFVWKSVTISSPDGHLRRRLKGGFVEVHHHRVGVSVDDGHLGEVASSLFFATIAAFLVGDRGRDVLVGVLPAVPAPVAPYTELAATLAPFA